jgi:hypothetical protein
MASDSIDDEKPNFRPKKFVDANGKSLGTCYCFTKSWCGSSIYATSNNYTKNRNRVVFDKPGLFEVKQSLVEYSLHKKNYGNYSMLFDKI